MKTQFVTKNPGSPGFAVAVALLLMAFIFLLLISLAAVTRVELATTQNMEQSMIAKQNALLGAMVAMGELQKHSGPDQRVTGKADIMLPGDDGELTTEEIRNYWSSARNPHWTGVWKNGNETEFDPANPTAFNAQANRLSWLVSGSETGLNIDPNAPISGLSTNTKPTDPLYDAQRTEYRLLVSPTANGDTPIRAVSAPLIPVKTDAGQTNGNYAWWVGDEGVKARINLINPYSEDPGDTSKIKQLSSAQRMAIEALTADADLNSSDVGLDGFYQPNDKRYEDLMDIPQIRMINDDSDYAVALALRYHDLTTYSRGVLADVKNGGLKRDLSYILGQPDITTFQNAINNAFDEPVAIEPTGNRVLTEVATPFSKLPPNISGSGHDFDQKPGILAYTPTWEQLWSFHNMGNQPTASPPGVYDDNGHATPRLNTPSQHGLYPIHTQAKLFYSLEVDGSGKIFLKTKPLVVLANPYAVPLGPADYTIRFDRPSLQIRLGGDNTNPDDPVNPFDPEEVQADESQMILSSFTEDDSVYSVPRSGLGDIQLIVRSEGLAAGEAQVFTLDGDFEIPTNANAQKSFSAIMVNDYDPSASLRLDTEESISGRYEYAVLHCKDAKIFSDLYLNYDPDTASTEGDRKLIHSVIAKPNGSDKNEAFFVYPTNSGEQPGGGIGFSLYDLATPNLQQSLFYQLNYRTSVIFFHGYTSQSHPLEWASTLTKKGEPGNEQYFGANLLRADDSFTKVRWGPLHTGIANYQSVTPPSIAGTEVGLNNYLYDIPRPGVPMASLGQFQHLNTTALLDRKSWGSSSYGASSGRATTVQSWQVNYPVSNSYAHPRVDRNRLFDARPFSGYHYDGSYLWNDVLWDRFFLSTYPASEDFDFEGDTLVNNRYQPFRTKDNIAWDEEENFRGDGDSSNQANSRMAATNLLAEGAFNVNSTSKEAWKALLSSLRGVELGSESDADNLTAPFSRTFEPLGGSEQAETGLHANAWNGFRNLTPDEVDAIAEEMVRQVRLRGPFTSMADFVNRKIVDQDNDPYDLGVSGALQSAIDQVTNLKSNVAPPFDVESNKTTESLLVDQDFHMPTATSGFPGYLLQGDVLSSIGAHLTVRSDTFRIRSYGEALNPISQKVEARAWCEVIVQRVPDYVVEKSATGGNDPFEEATDANNILLGRRYEIVSFRWLDSEEI